MIAFALYPLPSNAIDRCHDMTTTTSAATTATAISGTTTAAIANRALSDWCHLADSGVIQDLIFSESICHLAIDGIGLVMRREKMCR